MIYAVTCNPALDWMMRLDAFAAGGINRSFSESLSMGGKGVNVATMLTNLGVPVCAWGFIAGDTGRTLEAALQDRGITTDLIHLPEGLTRINVKLKTMDDASEQARCIQETEINGAGPRVDAAALDRLRAQVDTLRAGDVLVLSGSLAPGCPVQLYRELVERAHGCGALAVVDAAEDLLEAALDAHPFLIKPNNDELAQLFDIDGADEASLERAAVELAARTRGFVLVSRGAKGAFLASEEGVVGYSVAPRGALVNSVGAGDSMVAGFLAGWLNATSLHDAEIAAAGDPLAALTFATAAGSATAFCEGIASGEEVLALVPDVFITPGPSAP